MTTNVLQAMIPPEEENDTVLTPIFGHIRIRTTVLASARAVFLLAGGPARSVSAQVQKAASAGTAEPVNVGTSADRLQPLDPDNPYIAPTTDRVPTAIRATRGATFASRPTTSKSNGWSCTGTSEEGLRDSSTARPALCRLPPPETMVSRLFPTISRSFR